MYSVQFIFAGAKRNGKMGRRKSKGHEQDLDTLAPKREGRGFMSGKEQGRRKGGGRDLRTQRTCPTEEGRKGRGKEGGPRRWGWVRQVKGQALPVARWGRGWGVPRRKGERGGL